ncbi:histone chaperone Rttp106-like-domain-containing protein [Lipomyces kononenkoae]|uniref:Histone chaperone Rttp106-like-domain-containing protein n=1 Tax=Lipomyces kononenkoae TaxID=34357 RepID=A0ACC3T1B8_LIPKO
MADNNSFLHAIADADLRDSIASYIATHSDAAPVFERLICHFTTSNTASTNSGNKKRKLGPELEQSSSSSERKSPLLIAPGISFSVPQRKKLTLVIYTDRILVVPANATNSQIMTDATATTAIYSISTRDLAGFMYLQTPARATKSYTIVVLPKTAEPDKTDAMVFTVPDSSGSTFTRPQSTTTSNFDNDEPAGAIILGLFANLGIPRLNDESTFAVDAHRGTKDGYLHFSTAGVLFGFKKPVWYVPISQIASVSYSSITRVTFNLIITTVAANNQQDDNNDGGDDEEIEFGMIDQEKFGQIDEYVKKWQLADRSMAQERMAKPELKHKHQQVRHDGGGGGSSSSNGELAKAEHMWRQQAGNDNEIDDDDDDLEQTSMIAVNDEDDDDDDDEEEDENFEVDEDDDDGGSPSQSSIDDEEEEQDRGDYDEPDYEGPAPYPY